MTTNTTFF